MDALNNATLSRQDNRFTEPNLFFADPAVFDVFSFPLLRGDPTTALSEPLTMVMTQQMARKYFGAEDPIGQILQLNDGLDIHVTGILADIPLHTQLRCELLVSMRTLELIMGPAFTQWGRIGVPYTYILLDESADPGLLEAKLPEMMSKYLPAPLAKMTRLFLQPLNRIYLHSDLKMELEPRGNMGYVYLFSALAALILLIACINFINLATARASRRAVEIGLRKTIGAHRRQLIVQFLTDSIVLAMGAILLGILLFESARPLFNRVLQREFALPYLTHPLVIPALFLTALLLGTAAGFYPALLLSRYHPLETIKGQTPVGSKAFLRKLLVVFQFIISAALIIAALVIYRQIDYVKHKDLGFARDQVAAISLPKSFPPARYDAWKNHLLQLTGIRDVSGADLYPGSRRMMKIGVRPEGFEDSGPQIMILSQVDDLFLKTIGAGLAEGRDFDPRIATDRTEAIIINQAAAVTLGWREPIGKTIHIPNQAQRGQMDAFRVIGVVNDFHLRSLHEKIEPLIIRYQEGPRAALLVSLESAEIGAILEKIRAAWQSQFGDQTPLEVTFLDDAFARYYESEEKLALIVTIFCLLSVFIAALGLLGLVTFTVESRTREIGIRKVLGASVAGVAFQLTRDFFKWVLAGTLLAPFVAWYILRQWLQQFVYRIGLPYDIFFMAMISCLTVALMTVIFQAVRVANLDPVKTLKYE